MSTSRTGFQAFNTMAWDLMGLPLAVHLRAHTSWFPR